MNFHLQKFKLQLQAEQLNHSQFQKVMVSYLKSIKTMKIHAMSMFMAEIMKIILLL